MTVLAALARHYDRLARTGGAPPYGYSLERIGFVIPLNEDGTPAGPPIDRRSGEGRNRAAPSIAVPASFKRPGTTPRAFFLWDNTAFALGVTAAEGKDAPARFEAFRDRHLRDLDGTGDAGLLALRRFVETWRPAMFDALGWPQEIKDQNVAFVLESERLQDRFIHDRPAARTLWARLAASPGGEEALCLVSGKRGPIARLHPAIRGVWGAQSSGASLVSFNLDAFTSYGHEQGANAPVGEAAAFAYTTALNSLLAQGSRNRIRIGDASTVFWAEAGDRESEEVAETVFGAMLGNAVDEELQSGKVRRILEAIAGGRPLTELDPDLAEGVRFCVLGLSPNLARLSVRFWFEDSFGRLADNVAAHARDMAVDPPPREALPGIWRLLIETAVQRKSDNIAPQLTGDMLRAILSGGRYPATLLATLLMRLRADRQITPLRVALLKAVVARSRRLDTSSTAEGPPVSYDPECRESGYLLGRLFAVYEHAQSAALGRSVNATMKENFYGGASSTPQSVFPLLDRGSVPHLAKLRRERRGQAVGMEKQIAGIMEQLAPGGDAFPRSLAPAQQALFALGYYHQHRRRFAGRSDRPAVEETAR